jgi:hypothetical protein
MVPSGALSKMIQRLSGDQVGCSELRRQGVKTGPTTEHGDVGTVGPCPEQWYAQTGCGVDSAKGDRAVTAGERGVRRRARSHEGNDHHG